jgi:hypothetical protein
VRFERANGVLREGISKNSGKLFRPGLVAGRFCPLVLLFGRDYQAVHSGVETGVVAGFTVGAHIKGTICLVSVAIKSFGEIAILYVMATYSWLYLIFGAHNLKYRQEARSSESLLGSTIKVGN